MAKAHQTKPRMNPDNVRAIERAKGRKLTEAEIWSGKVQPDQPLTAEQQREATLEAIGRENWKPVLVSTIDPNSPKVLRAKMLELRATEPGSEAYLEAVRLYNVALKKENLAEHDQQIKERMDHARRRNMSSDELGLEMNAEIRAKLNAADHVAKAHGEHLASVKSQVDRLTALRAQLDSEPDYDEADLFAIDKALIQLQTVGACQETAKQFIADADAMVAAKKKAKGDQIAQRLAEVERTRIELLADQEKITGKPAEKKSEQTIVPPVGDSASTAAWRKWKALTADANTAPELVEAASKAWLDAERAELKQQPAAGESTAT